MKTKMLSLLLGILLITSCDNRIPYFEKTTYRFDNQEQKTILYTKDIIYTVSVYENEEPVATDVVLPEGKSESISGSWYTVSFSHDNRQQVELELKENRSGSERSIHISTMGIRGCGAGCHVYQSK